MTWLKKIGSVVLHWLPIALGIVSPAIHAGTVTAKVLGDLNLIHKFVVMVEGMIQGIGGAQTGSAKLAAIAPAVQQLIIQYAEANLPGASNVKDPVKLARAAQQITSGFADALNSFGG